MKNNLQILLIILIFCVGIITCKKDTGQINAEKIVKEWTGKEIIFPDNINCISTNKDTTCISPNSTPFKILVYTDSTGCTSCKLQLYKWNMLIEEIENEMRDLVNIQFYFQPKDMKELQFLFRRDTFNHPAYIDIENKLHKLNNLPSDIRFQTFLLDENNRVVLIGNPTNNNQIWNLYKQTIKGEQNIDESKTKVKNTTNIEVEESTVEIKDLEINKTSKVSFTIKNVGEYPLLISDVNASCGCTVPRWDKKPILPNTSTTIDVEVTPDSIGYFRKTISVFCNIEQKNVTLVMKGVTKK